MAKGNLFSINMKEIKKNTEFNVTVDIVVVIMLLLFYLSSIMSLTFYEKMNIDIGINFKVFVVLCVIMLVSITSKYSVGLGLLMTLVIILMKIFTKELTNYLIDFKLFNNSNMSSNSGCPKLSIDVNSPLTEEEFRLVQQLILCDMDQYSKCLMLGIDFNNPNNSYNRKIRKRYHPDLKNVYEKLNIKYDEMVEVSKFIGGCINEQL